MTEKESNLEEEILNATKTILINGIKALDGYKISERIGKLILSMEKYYAKQK